MIQEPIRRRELTPYAQKRALSQRIQTPLANSLLWDVIVQTCDRLNGYPVVRFRGRHYLLDHPKGNGVANPWPPQGAFCRLLARPGDDRGDLCILNDGLVVKWDDRPGRPWERRPTIYGIQEDVQPVVTLG